MSYFPKGHHDSADEVDDFDEYDSTPYGGGYDISLTYGRPLPPSDETCYPNTSSASDDFDYDRPQYTTYAEPSAYAYVSVGDDSGYFASYSGISGDITDVFDFDFAQNLLQYLLQYLLQICSISVPAWFLY